MQHRCEAPQQPDPHDAPAQDVAHAAFEHLRPVGQALPQRPQLAPSLARSTQTPSQFVSVEGHAQSPVRPHSPPVTPVQAPEVRTPEHVVCVPSQTATL